MLSIGMIGITTNIGKTSTKIVDMSGFLILLRPAAAWGSSPINIRLHAPSPMLSLLSANKLTTKRRRREYFSMQTFHCLLTMAPRVPKLCLLTMAPRVPKRTIQISDTQALEH